MTAPAHHTAFGIAVATTTLAHADAMAADLDLSARSALGTDKIVELIVALALVIGLVLVLGWIGRRMQSNRHHSSNLRTVATVSVGSKERVLIVEADGERLLLGVTARQINMLHLLPETTQTDRDEKAEADRASAGMATSFARIQGALMGRRPS